MEHRDGSSLTINVEYNQLDPLLRATINKEGDVNDATGICVCVDYNQTPHSEMQVNPLHSPLLCSGWSPFPGNINQLVLKLSSYVEQLQKTGGVISEFVNPKYKCDLNMPCTTNGPPPPEAYVCRR